jgi:MinD-like ATPase involved in chromosome partitioning or flagellar assembly
MGKIIAFHSYKGGTGKTLLSINLAATYAKMNKSVCLFDLDFRAPSLHAAFASDDVECWLNEYLNGTYDIKRVLIDLSRKHGNGGHFYAG